jgi:hypothetical protein
MKDEPEKEAGEQKDETQPVPPEKQENRDARRGDRRQERREERRAERRAERAKERRETGQSGSGSTS